MDGIGTMNLRMPQFPRRLYRQVEEHTIEARKIWADSRSPINWESDPMPKVWGVGVLVEEIGKLSRCANKLAISQDAGVTEQWNKEAKYRIITSMSMLRRLAESWDELPDRPSTNTKLVESDDAEEISLDDAVGELVARLEDRNIC